MLLPGLGLAPLGSYYRPEYRCSWDSGEGFTDDVFKDFCCARYSKVKTGVSSKTKLGDIKVVMYLDSVVNSI